MRTALVVIIFLSFPLTLFAQEQAIDYFKSSKAIEYQKQKNISYVNSPKLTDADLFDFLQAHISSQSFTLQSIVGISGGDTKLATVFAMYTRKENNGQLTPLIRPTMFLKMDNGYWISYFPGATEYRPSSLLWKKNK